MITLYIFLTLFIALIIWLGLRRKWKTVLWTVVSLIVVAIVGWYSFLQIISEAFGEKCEENRVWEIETYVIVEKKCIGFAGPYYYSVFLYENNKEIDYRLFVNDSTCVLRFNPAVGDTLTFDICEMELKEK